MSKSAELTVLCQTTFQLVVNTKLTPRGSSVQVSRVSRCTAQQSLYFRCTHGRTQTSQIWRHFPARVMKVQHHKILTNGFQTAPCRGTLTGDSDTAQSQESSASCQRSLVSDVRWVENLTSAIQYLITYTVHKSQNFYMSKYNEQSKGWFIKNGAWKPIEVVHLHYFLKNNKNIEII